VIPARELFDLRAEWSLDVGVIETSRFRRVCSGFLGFNA